MSERLVEKMMLAMLRAEEWSSFFSEQEARVLALAALRAIRDAGDDFLAPGDDALAEGLGIDAAWQAMIDAAIAEAEESTT